MSRSFRISDATTKWKGIDSVAANPHLAISLLAVHLCINSVAGGVCCDFKTSAETFMLPA